jgi:hypothetical protein
MDKTKMRNKNEYIVESDWDLLCRLVRGLVVFCLVAWIAFSRFAYSQAVPAEPWSGVPTPVNVRTVPVVVNGQARTAVQCDLPPNTTISGIGWFLDGIFTPSERLLVSGSTYAVLPLGKDPKESTIHAVAYKKIGNVTYSSLPSSPGLLSGASPWWGGTPPPSVGKVSYEIENNVGATRLRLFWGSDKNFDQIQTGFNVYRDGEIIGRNVWIHEFYRYGTLESLAGVYKVVPVNIKEGKFISPFPSLEQSLENASSVTVKSIVKSIVKNEIGVVKIAKIIPNDDSATVFFDAVEGAKDYRVYVLSSDTANGHAGATERLYKYSAGGLSIELNGIAPVSVTRVIVEAVDKFGPYHTEDFPDARFVGGLQPSGQVVASLNGIGDPSNVPNVLARSEVVELTAKPFTLSGEQVFLDNFRDFKPLKRKSIGADELAKYFHGGLPADGYNVTFWENDKWSISTSDIYLKGSSLFVMGSHFMDVLQDGGGVNTNVPPHNNRGNMSMSPKQIFNIGEKETLHITFEVDAHFADRSWVSVGVVPAKTRFSIMNNELVGNKLVGDPRAPRLREDDNQLAGDLDPIDPDKPRKYGEALVFAVRPNAVRVIQSDPDKGIVPIPRESKDTWRDNTYSPTSLNGDMTWLDKRHRFDIYLSRTHIRATEDRMDGTPIVTIKDEDLLFPLVDSKVKIYFMHQFYHSEVRARVDTRRWNSQETYWYNRSPFRDERHWDNMGAEIIK